MVVSDREEGAIVFWGWVLGLSLGDAYGLGGSVYLAW